MGFVKTEELDNGNIGLEITYGGLQSPFGGVDSSAPPAYIDPKCFTSVDGFVVIDNKLVAAAFFPLQIPPLWSGISGIKLLKIGSWYTSTLQQLNYALGYIATPQSSPAASVVYTFYITYWTYDNTGAPFLKGNDSISVRIFDVELSATVSSLIISVIQGKQSNFTDNGSLNLDYGNAGVYAGTISFAYTAGATIQTVVTGIIAAINAASGSTGFTAAPSVDGFSVILTSIGTGSPENQLCVADSSVSTGLPTTPPPFYFAIAPYSVEWTFLIGGGDQTFVVASITLQNITTTDVGGILYISNAGPFILKTSGPNTLTVSSTYAGQQILSKFGGSLIGLGLLPALGIIDTNTDMILSWSAATELDEWNPIDANGNVTGAGFEQIGDIDDYLSGLIVTNGTGFIIRAQGISYMTVTGNATLPFDVSHIALADIGEGAQIPSLICQYDQVGFYAANSDVYQLSGSISKIGSKVATLLEAAQAATAQQVSGSAVCPIMIGGNVYPILLMVMIGGTPSVYLYNPANNTWMTATLGSMAEDLVGFSVGVLQSTSSTAGNRQKSIDSLAIAFQQLLSGIVQSPVLYSLQEGLINTLSVSEQHQITFPQEEISFGRDVTIDALYVALWADIPENVLVEFFYSGILFSSVMLTPAQFNTLDGNPIELQIFPTSTTTSGAFTVHSPQLQIVLSNFGDTSTGQVRFSKIASFASFDPKQRPV